MHHSHPTQGYLPLRVEWKIISTPEQYGVYKQQSKVWWKVIIGVSLGVPEVSEETRGGLTWQFSPMTTGVHRGARKYERGHAGGLAWALKV